MFAFALHSLMCELSVCPPRCLCVRVSYCWFYATLSLSPYENVQVWSCWQLATAAFINRYIPCGAFMAFDPDHATLLCWLS